ncbi:MAG: hypothetical protein H0T41_05920, partial [Rhodobacteraceae bacterium]|nr:hypothetical protein [Paracoccaceae bacterium]
MGDYGPLARETSNPAPGAAPVIDAIALEERLKVARELRAEAIARRQGAGSDISPQSGAQTCPLTGMEDGPPLRPVDPVAPDPAAQIPAAPPLHAACRPARLPSLDPSRQNARAPQVAHPLVALLALGLSVSVVLSRGAPETPASLPV